MARLTHPTAGTVVHVEGELEDRYRRQGWSEVDGKRSPRRRSKPKPEVDTDE